MRLTTHYAPTALEDVTGQAAVVEPLSMFLADPYPTAILLRGGTGVGKTTIAKILSNALADPWFGECKESGAKFDASKVDKYFGPQSPFRFALAKDRFFVLRIEELERLPAVAENMMKDLMEEAVQRWKLIVIATSNDTSKLETALLHRFKTFDFDSGPAFAEAFYEWLRVVWAIEADVAMPAEAVTWGLMVENGFAFSARLALDCAEKWLLTQRARKTMQVVA